MEAEHPISGGEKENEAFKGSASFEESLFRVPAGKKDEIFL